MIFCKIEKDEKTYKYLKEYLDFISDENLTNKNILNIDNKIQHQELYTHLNFSKIDPNEDSARRHQEIEQWIKNNAKSFRQYLSSIKLIACVSFTMGIKKGKDLKFEDFIKLCDTINSLKNILIDHIF
jgi:hypothetical protein